MSVFDLRRATGADLEALVHLEKVSFDPARRSSAESLSRALKSRAQEIWVATNLEGDMVLGALQLRFYSRTVRIYSVCVRPEARGLGVGNRLLEQAFIRAEERAAVRLSLEVDARDKKTCSLYERHGFKLLEKLPNYYARGRHGLRLTAPVHAPEQSAYC